MHIVLNCALTGPDATGIGVYAGALAAALPATDNGEHTYDVYVGGTVPGVTDRPASGRVKYHVVSSSGPLGRLRWDIWQIGVAARRAGADLLHSTTAYLPIHPPCPCVLTVHDLAIYHFPATFRVANRTLGRRIFEMSVRRAAALIAVSEATRRDLTTLLDVPSERITVIPEAVDPIFQAQTAQTDIPRIQHTYGIQRPYVLSVATAEPRKNLGRLLDAYCACLPIVGADLQLVLVGRQGWLAGPLEQRIRHLAANGMVKLLGYVPRADLPGLYAGAAAFAYPSLYEGFGLPVLEALACGTPALTSNSSSLPEVAGDAALLAEPTSVDAIAAGLIRLLKDADFALALRLRGPARAAEFSWEVAARRTRYVYERASTYRTVSPPEPALRAVMGRQEGG